jgi:hypothetical protein
MFNTNGDSDPSISCEFWRSDHIPRSPLHPQTPFLRWMSNDSEESFRKRGEKRFSVESVGYSFNSLGYRSPEFDREPGRAGVLCVGDSNTLGIGTPWEALWTSLVVDFLEEFWGQAVLQSNLAWQGTGSDYVAMMIHQSIDVIKPDAVFVLWSFVGRMTWFPNARSPVHFLPEWVPDAFTKDHAAYLRLSTNAHGFFNFVRNFHFVNDCLWKRGIPFLWGNIEPFSLELLRAFVPLDGYVGDWRFLDFARDGLHAGVESHLQFADLMKSKIRQKKVLPKFR